MNRKNIKTNLLFAALLVGFFTSCRNGEQSDRKGPEQTRVPTDTTVVMSAPTSGTDYSKALTGRFILAESNCAGFEFLNDGLATWTNEILCDLPDTLRIHWVDKETFFVRTKERINEGCPPRVDVYKVLAFDGRQLLLRSFQSGWTESADDTLRFEKRAAN